MSWSGIKNISESPNRLHAAREAYRAAGAETKEFYLVMRRYDGVPVIEAPEVETLEKPTPDTRSQGAVRREFISASTKGKYRKIIASLS
ncbi:MAG: GYD domain-containing protein [Anaerolineae bacterium]|nr:GYD domain-containing protein [Anaerolineae bacterium]NIQ77035.1 GYD domain-containing protein [Anaerolineae bacterium]